MAWDFQTDPEFQKKLDWAKDFVVNELIPLEPLLGEFSDDVWQRDILAPLKQKVKDQDLWACHLGKERGGQGYGQLALA